MVTMSQDSNKKQDKKPPKGNKYQGNELFVGFIKEGPLAGVVITSSKPLAGQNSKIMAAAISHSSNKGWIYITKLLLDFSKEKTENDEGFLVTDPDPSEWTTAKQVPKMGNDGKPVVVDGQPITVEIKVVNEFKTKMAMAKWKIKYESGQADWKDFKYCKISFCMLLLKQVDPIIIIQLDLIPGYKLAKQQQCLVGTLKALQSVCLANKDGSKKVEPIEGLIQLKRNLTHQQNYLNNAKYREHVLAAYKDLKAHTHKFSFGLGALYEVISKKTPPNKVSWTGVDMWDYYVKLDKATCDALEKEVDDLTQACI